MNLKEFCQKIPKVELHAHLNGSLSENTLAALGVPKESLKEYQLQDQFPTGPDKLSQCFSLFKTAHDATTTPDSVYLATKYVIEEFSKENVIYLEIRSTPRNEERMTKKQYIESIVQAIEDDKSDILVKLILSIDRTHDLQNSENTLDLILEMRNKFPDIIKGIDLCGNPGKGNFNETLFQRACDKGLKVTLHCAEVKNDAEVSQMLKFKPDRIGHGTFIHPDYGGSDRLWQLYCDLKIPTECCLTSNVLSGTSKGYQYHHVQEWKKNNLPYVLSTDDKGVFRTSLSEEYYYAVKYLNFSKDDIYASCCTAIQSSFADEEEKEKLKQAMLQSKSILTE